MKISLSFFKAFPCIFAIFADEFSSGVAYPLLISIFVMNKDYFPTMTNMFSRDLYFSLIVILPSLFKIIGAYSFGDISDFLGRKKALIICLVSDLICALLMYWGIIWNVIALLILSRILVGLTSGKESICQAVIADVSTHADKALHMRWITLSRGLGLVLGSIVSGLMMKWMGSHINIAVPFYMGMTIGISTLIFIILGFNETFSTQRKSKLSFRAIISGVGLILQNKKIRLLLIASFFLKFGIGVYYDIAAIYLKQDLHTSAWLMGYFYSFIGTGYIFGILIGLPLLLKILPLKWIITITCLLQGILMLLTGVISTNIWVWSVAISIGALDFAGYTALLALISNTATKEHQGLAMGALMATTAFAFMLSGACLNLLNLIHALGIIKISGVATLLGAMVFITYSMRFNRA